MLLEEDNNLARKQGLKPILGRISEASARNSLRELFSFSAEREMTATLSVSHCLAAAACKEGRRQGRTAPSSPSVAARLCTYPSGNSFVLAERWGERRVSKMTSFSGLGNRKCSCSLHLIPVFCFDSWNRPPLAGDSTVFLRFSEFATLRTGQNCGLACFHVRRHLVCRWWRIFAHPSHGLDIAAVAARALQLARRDRQGTPSSEEGRKKERCHLLLNSSSSFNLRISTAPGLDDGRYFFLIFGHPSRLHLATDLYKINATSLTLSAL